MRPIERVKRPFDQYVSFLGGPSTMDVPATHKLDLDNGSGLYVTSFHASGRAGGCDEGQLSEFSLNVNQCWTQFV